MANLTNSKTIWLDGDTLVLSAGDYEFDFLQNDKVKVLLDEGQTTMLSGGEFDGVSAFQLGENTQLSADASVLAGRTIDGTGSLNITGISFVGADAAADHKFEPSVNLDGLLQDMVSDRGITGTIDSLTVNGSEGEAYKLLWDHLDDEYSYYNTAINDAFIDLGIAYAKHLLAGGNRLDDVIVKYAPDGADADELPERSQTLHDNLLGNLHEASIRDRFDAAQEEEIILRIQDAGLGDFIGEKHDLTDGRPYFGGNDDEDPQPTRDFDDVFFA